MNCSLSILASLALASCATVPQPPPTVPPPPPCPISASSDWTAWVDAMPGPDNKGPRLNVTGKVTLPENWPADFRTAIQVRESDPVQVVVDIDVQTSNDDQLAPVAKRVHGSWPNQPRVGSVTVMCRGTELTRISPVNTAL